ncbi:MAG: ABC transporter substrate-binding protein, partial [Minwuiales bacterium]|nr:ABC transporter substrate-binding protein [Minwuiales bacterium]
HAFDFEWTNKNLFYGQYERMNSMFENSPLAHRGKPSPEELAVLEPFRDQVPDEVFGDAFVAPTTDGNGNIRGNLRAAFRLLKEAGWTVTDGRLTNGAGEQLSLEFLIYQPTFERVLGPYVKNLERLGIDASIRLVDVAQYQNRQEEYDFDVIGLRLPVALTPGVELRNFWGSAGADSLGSRNLAGVKNPVVDALIETIIDAGSRPELTTAVHALDRVLMWNHYVVTNWYRDVHPIAYWNRFSRPALKPKYALGMLDTWWFDERKAALTDQGKPVPTD